MSRLDDLIADLTSNRISRRQFMQRASALGLALPFVHANFLTASAQEGKNKIVWASPRGTLEVLDDYPYWVALELGYFGDIETEMEPATLFATSGELAVSEGKADMTYPSPGVYTLGIEAGIPLMSVWEMGAYDVFDFAFAKGAGFTDLKQFEGKTVLLGSSGWSAITDPMFSQAGADHTKVTYQEVAGWGQALAAGQGDGALSWEGLRAQWEAEGLVFDYILGKDWSKFPANSFVIRKSDYEDPALKDLYTRYLRGWAMGLEYGYHNPRAATEITLKQFPALQETFAGKEAVAVESMWQLATVFRGDWAARQGWGWHDLEAWKLFIEHSVKTGYLKEALDPETILTNEFVAAGNEFDKEKVKADAAAYSLSPELEAVAVPEGAGV
jgi:NitT/TauT family transport system substrate-binding protein